MVKATGRRNRDGRLASCSNNDHRSYSGQLKHLEPEGSNQLLANHAEAKMGLTVNAKSYKVQTWCRKFFDVPRR